MLLEATYAPWRMAGFEVLELIGADVAAPFVRQLLDSPSSEAAAQFLLTHGLADRDELAPFVGPLAEAWTGDLDSMIARRIIRVLITPTRTQYWIDRGRQSGAEYVTDRTWALAASSTASTTGRCRSFMSFARAI